MVFQEALTALNPTMKIGKQVLEALLATKRYSAGESQNKVIELLQYVGIPNPQQRYHQYPHELSGGMRQRVVIAIALALSPKLLIADEPTTALDVTIEAQVLDLIRRIQREREMAILFITHDLSLVAGFCDFVYLMDQGRIVDEGDVEEVFYRSNHPYTRALIEGTLTFRGVNV
jgi:oligopeptide transport system ATP-binding protein